MTRLQLRFPPARFNSGKGCQKHPFQDTNCKSHLNKALQILASHRFPANNDARHICSFILPPAFYTLQEIRHIAFFTKWLQLSLPSNFVMHQGAAFVGRVGGRGDPHKEPSSPLALLPLSS